MARQKKEEKKKDKKSKRSPSRRRALKIALVLTAVLALWATLGDWFVHHPRAWLDDVCNRWPRFVTGPLLWIGNPVADITDGLDLTGEDAVYSYDLEAPSGSVSFAGLPQRVGDPAPADIRIIDRGEFIIGWSDTLRHPVWCAYHVTAEERHPDDGERPGFCRDKSVPAAPRPGDYTGSSYDRGHMAPNHAILTRYGEEARKLTFQMSNIAPQSPALNRGVWKDFEHRIANLWTRRFGEIWVIVGALPSRSGERFGGTNGIDIPSGYYQIIIAQETSDEESENPYDVRALAVVFPQDVDWNAWGARYITSIDALEELTGLDFNPDMPYFLQAPLESHVPTRLWPVRKWDIFKQIALRFR